MTRANPLKICFNSSFDTNVSTYSISYACVWDFFSFCFVLSCLGENGVVLTLDATVDFLVEYCCSGEANRKPLVHKFGVYASVTMFFLFCLFASSTSFLPRVFLTCLSTLDYGENILSLAGWLFVKGAIRLTSRSGSGSTLFRLKDIVYHLCSRDMSFLLTPPVMKISMSRKVLLDVLIFLSM